mmetsp:Transcript_32465/g.81351  ORF Transcript_32465/g.81351 Transcript_32465/m.81351 type:complete len:350 (-) Transcript_32465:851-1900(-)
MGNSASNGFGKRTTAQEAVRDISLAGRTIIVTGANCGVGFEAARVFAQQGAHVVLGCRTASKADAAVSLLRERTGNDTVESIPLDLASFASVRSFVDEFNARDLPLHALVNNAGVMGTPHSHTEDGFEMQFGTNHMGHFLLTHLLLPKLLATATPEVPARVVNLASTAHNLGGPNFDDLNMEKGYAPWTAYGRSKSCNILFTMELAKRYGDQHLIACAVHPGVIPTELGRNNVFASLFYTFGRLFMKSHAQGAATTVYCTTAPEILAESPDDPLHAPNGNGRYYADCNLERTASHITEEAAARLWDVSLELAGLVDKADDESADEHVDEQASSSTSSSLSPAAAAASSD